MKTLLTTDDWLKDAKDTFHSAADLLHYLNIKPTVTKSIDRQLQNQSNRKLKAQDFIDISADTNTKKVSFPLLVPKNYIDRMRAANALKAALKQVLPSKQELFSPNHYHKDPLDEYAQSPVPGVIYKYHNRALLTVGSHCAVNCRFCFRKNIDYKTLGATPKNFANQINWLKKNPQISEVILSGGDPLRLNNKLFLPLFTGLESISHITSLRIHSRTPVVIPSRVDSSFIALSKLFTKRKVFVLHINHPGELDASVAASMDKLRAANFHVYSQTVLLRDVNDSLEVLCTLFEKLIDNNIQPYYLHTLDPVAGAAHFDLPLDQVRRLYGSLCASLPGYAVPKLVRETIGLPAKSLIPPLF